jgi:hypothetical protein
MSKVNIYVVRKKEYITKEWKDFCDEVGVSDYREPMLVTRSYGNDLVLRHDAGTWFADRFDIVQQKVKSHLPEWL